MKPRPFTIAVMVGAFVGLLFASVSTYDFAQHVDRQVHDLHCSFVPGLSGAEAESGCQVTLLSEYSSFWRSAVWGGVPISLPAMAVFAFLLFFAVELVVTRRQGDSRATGFLALATGLPALASIVMGIISIGSLDAVCKLCVGIYAASALCLIGGIGAWWRARGEEPVADDVQPEKKPARPPTDEHERKDPAWAGGPRTPTEPPETERRPRRRPRGLVSWGYLAGAFALGVVFVVFPVLGYVAAMPDHSRYIGSCGALDPSEDAPEDVLLELGQGGDIPAIEILDPLCPACRGFEDRLESSGYAGELDRDAVLFPLDDQCNWMVSGAVHPGACTVSYAMLCAGDRAEEVLAWAFAEQEDIRRATEADPEAAERMVAERFPDLIECVRDPKTEARLNQGLRWAVKQSLPVMTPQLYVDDVKLCDEDVDLGLDFALGGMIERYRAGALHADESRIAEPTGQEGAEGDEPTAAKPTEERPPADDTGTAGEDGPEDTGASAAGADEETDDGAGAEASAEDEGVIDRPPAGPGPEDEPGGAEGTASEGADDGAADPAAGEEGADAPADETEPAPADEPDPVPADETEPAPADEPDPVPADEATGDEGGAP